VTYNAETLFRLLRSSTSKSTATTVRCARSSTCSASRASGWIRTSLSSTMTNSSRPARNGCSLHR